MIIVDTSVWIDYFNGRINPHTNKLDSLLGSELIATGDLILTELLQGFSTTAAYRRARALMDGLVCFEMVGRDAAIAAAENFRFLRTRGVTVRKTIDALIATFCLSHKHQLLHADRDFDPFERFFGLLVVR